MGNTFSVNHMTRTYNSYARTQEMLSRAGKPKEFSRELVEQYERMKETSGVEEIGVVSTKDMSMEEYKEYIRDKISQIPLNPSQSGWIWNIHITEEGFEAMKNDPEYEQHVLDIIRSNFSFYDPWHSKNWSVLHFGATDKESYGESYGMGNAFELKKEETFWERRLEKKKKMKKQLDKQVEKRKLQEKEWTETLIRRKEYYESIANGEKYPIVDEQMIKAKAAAFFDANIIVGNSGTNAL
ncbi:MAG: hypothetical protein K2H34_04440 [Lachnospiraceae bacterium]|nr:hypothetical protein [Lachnospiraceae bacterium]